MPLAALSNKITNALKDRPCLIVFDRDGTLSPLCPDPKDASISPEIKLFLNQLSSLPNVKVGILSARGLQSLFHDFDRENLILAGNYGLEIIFPQGESFTLPEAEAARPLLYKAKLMLEKNLPYDAQTILEDHELSLCLHWHLSPVHMQKTIHSLIKAISVDIPGLSYRTLPTSYEIWPQVRWNKSNGLEQIVRTLKVNTEKTFFMYSGDSEPDEPAFSWVNEHKGSSIRIGEITESLAQFHIASPFELTDFFEKILFNLNKVTV